jgi:hypothetical protein
MASSHSYDDAGGHIGGEVKLFLVQSLGGSGVRAAARQRTIPISSTGQRALALSSATFLSARP